MSRSSDNDAKQTMGLLQSIAGYLSHLPHIEAKMAQLVEIEQQRLTIDINSMTPEFIKALTDALRKLTALILANQDDHQARQAAEKALTELQASDAALQNPELAAAAQGALDAANAVLPVEPPTDTTGNA
jgi:hypothetical protein